MLLRTISTAPGTAPGYVPPATPHGVPARVDDPTLVATLRHGRPEGEAGLVSVHGLGCPTVSAGAGLPVLCLHGLGHDAWDWAPLFQRVINDHGGRHGLRLVALDLPGFGLADKHRSERWTLQVLVDAVVAVTETLAAPPVVVGSSLGGHVAMLAALQHPALFRSLFLVSPGGFVPAPPAMQTLLRAYYSVNAIVSRREPEILSNSRRIFARAGHPLDDALQVRKLSVHRSTRAHEFAVPYAGTVDDVFEHVVTPRLGELRVPVQILVGERDAVVTPQACADAARRIGARFTVMPGVGHTPHLEATDAFVDSLLSFTTSRAA